ncbi:M23 family metallopeptidase [Streptomyces sp. KAU_LT]|uniref:murein hydrolase activator EnvC family protein n=1 Tax=Streptomyces sp. KAU_LT TaxID=3046669 RepID=UPI0024B64C8D|nr:M23 family metallopeptidase [Streptomyces sp. KAU_LT]MDI9830910.1 M23 family metallopeptidase [Streptomyces sp. KAU_LT]
MALRLVLLLLLTATVLLAPVPDLTPTAARVRAAPAPADPADPADPAEPGVPTLGRAWPVGSRPPVLRAWEPPATPYGRGHRGVDLAAPAGTPVRAVAAGRVSFAGRVAGKGVVSVELAGTGDPPLRTTYEPVRASVGKGEEVAAGAVVGTVEPAGSHCPEVCLHWGLRRGESYLNPLALLPPWLLHGPSRLLPVLGVPVPTGRGPEPGAGPGPEPGAGPGPEPGAGPGLSPALP